MAKFIFDKYEHLKCLASGGMGEVHLARQRGLAGFDRLVILKTLLPELSGDKDSLTQFLDEARVIGALNHPNIVSVIEVGRWKKTHYIAMEYVDGPTLSEIWKAAAKAKRGLPYLFTIRIIREAALGLAHAHQAKDIHDQDLRIVHRDVSPQNIMVRRDGLVKVVDFGIAKSKTQRSISGLNTIKGKLHYMSPEQLRNKSLDGLSDQFALGIVLWELTTGKRLFKGKTEEETIYNVLKKKVPAPTSFIESYPIGLERTVMRMLERKPEKRFSSCDEAATELRAILRIGERKSGVVSVKDFLIDLMGTQSSWSTVSEGPDPSAVTQEYLNPPGHLLQTEDDEAFTFSSVQGTFLVEKAEGTLVEFNEIDQISDWIMGEQLGAQDLFSDDGTTWTPLGKHPLFKQSFPSTTQPKESHQQASPSTTPAQADGSLYRAPSLPRIVTYSGIVFLDEDQDLHLEEPSLSNPSNATELAHESQPERLEQVALPQTPTLLTQPPTPVRSKKPFFVLCGFFILAILGASLLVHNGLIPIDSNLTFGGVPQTQDVFSIDEYMGHLRSDDQTILTEAAQLPSSIKDTTSAEEIGATLLIHLTLLRQCLEEYRLESLINKEQPNRQRGFQLCQSEWTNAQTFLKFMNQRFVSSPFYTLGQAHVSCLHGETPKTVDMIEEMIGSNPVALGSQYTFERQYILQACEADQFLWKTEQQTKAAPLQSFGLQTINSTYTFSDMRLAYLYASVWSSYLYSPGKDAPRASADDALMENALASVTARLPRDKKVVLLQRWIQTNRP